MILLILIILLIYIILLMKNSFLNQWANSFISNYQKETMQTSNDIFSFCGDKHYEGNKSIIAGNDTKRLSMNNHNTRYKIDLSPIHRSQAIQLSKYNPCKSFKPFPANQMLERERRYQHRLQKKGLEFL